MSVQLTIIVPFYNEEEALGPLKLALDEYLKITPVKSRVLFIDDGSTDKSLELVELICESDLNYNFLSLEENKGLSTALKAGIDHISTPYLGYIDADLQTSPEDFLLYFSHLNSCNMVNGIRVNRNDKFLKRISSQIANRFRRLIIHDNIKDTCCPLKIIETQLAKRIPFFRGMHRFMPALVQLLGGTVKQVKVSHFPRTAGKPKYNLSNRLIGPFLDTLAVLWMKHNWTDYHIKSHSLKSDLEIVELSNE